MKNLNRIWTYPLIVVGFVLIHTVSCKKANENVLSIGQSYQGGIIAYIFLPGDPGYNANIQHGLIASPIDQSTGITWYNGGNTSTGATASVLETGKDNTNTIFASQGAGNYAAKLCYDLVLNSYSDWYLPSNDELNKLYLNRIALGGFNSAGFYWSCSEVNASQTWYQYFFNGGQGTATKDNPDYIRAVRAF